MDTFKSQKELADIGRAKYGRRDNAIDTRSLKDTIMKMVATIEKQKQTHDFPSYNQ